MKGRGVLFVVEADSEGKPRGNPQPSFCFCSRSFGNEPSGSLKGNHRRWVYRAHSLIPHWQPASFRTPQVLSQIWFEIGRRSESFCCPLRLAVGCERKTEPTEIRWKCLASSHSFPFQGVPRPFYLRFLGVKGQRPSEFRICSWSSIFHF